MATLVSLEIALEWMNKLNPTSLLWGGSREGLNVSQENPLYPHIMFPSLDLQDKQRLHFLAPLLH